MKERGFTLIEVMVAAAVAALLITGVSAATNAAVTAAQHRKVAAREEESLSRALELVRDDWRGRVRIIKPDPPPPVGSTILVLATTSDSVTASGYRGTRCVTYVASEKGLRRCEGSSEVLLIKRPVRLDFWDGIAWRIESSETGRTLRFTLASLASVIIR